ncbi:MAG: lactate utilization protein, partial [Firmicutes bacterium]|nr:lactate utilization protein [Bacillota bacterium]
MSSREMILEKLHNAAAPDQINKNIITIQEPRYGDEEVFVSKATAAGAQVFRTNLHEAAGVIKTVLEEIGSKSIILSDEKIIKELGVQAIAGDLGIDCRYADDYPGAAYRRNVLQTEIGISSCDYALADSGSLVIIHDSDNQRLISLAPDYYIGIVKTSQMLKDRIDLA